jgi:hypothetical protein
VRREYGDESGGDRLHYFQLIFPSPDQAVLVAVVGLIGLLLIGLGRLVSADGGPAFSLVAGWGLAIFVFVAAGTLTPLPLSIVALLLAAPALGGLVLLVRDRNKDVQSWRRAGRVVLLALPLILIVAAIRASQWDDFAHWLPNAHYLVLYDRFPSLASPNYGSSWPAYPYGLPLVGYVASLITGEFSERTGILFNLLLLLAGGWLLADVISRKVESGPSTRGSLGAWGIAAAALFIVAIVNPSLTLSIVFTNNADNATSCALAVLLVAAMRWFDAANALRPERYRLAFLCGCCATAVLELKQSNVALLSVVAIALALVMLADRKRLERGWLSGLLALPLPLLTFLLWHHYTATEMPRGDMQFRSIAQWHFAEMGDMLRSALGIMLRKIGHFGLMAGLLIVAAVSFKRASLFDEEGTRYARAVGLSFLGYTAFLFFAYLVSFSADEAGQAASFWRYSTHLGMACLVAATALIAPRWRVDEAWRRRLAIAAIALVVIAPWANGSRLRFDLDKPHEGYSMAVVREMAPMLPSGAQVALLDLYGSGWSLAGMRYELIFPRERGRQWPPFTVFTRNSGVARDYLASPEARTAGKYVWIDNGGLGTKDIFGIDLKAGASYLLVREAAGYRLVHAWPDTPEAEHFSPEDFR